MDRRSCVRDCRDIQTQRKLQRLATVPGIGPLVATALFSGVGDPLQFKNGRQFAAWLGPTPKQRSSGGKSKLSGITKHGDTYLRTLLVQGARAVMRFAGRRDDRHSRWIKAVMQRRHVSVAAIPLANRTARIAWAVLTSNECFKLA
nr:IS110 family transposase [Paraburkholderia sp. SG-MS1]